MSNWIDLSTIAKKYHVEEEEIHKWTELEGIISSNINHTLFIDEGSLNSFLEKYKKVADVDAIIQKLRDERETHLQEEMKRYDEGDLVCRLHSTCFPLYLLLIKLLGTQISDWKTRNIFCAIAKGQDIQLVAKHYRMKEKEVISSFKLGVGLLKMNVKDPLIYLHQHIQELKKQCADCHRTINEHEQTIFEYKAKVDRLNRMIEKTKEKLADAEKLISVENQINSLKGKGLFRYILDYWRSN